MKTQRSRGRALLFLYAQCHAPTASPPGKECGTRCTGGCWAPGPAWTGAENLALNGLDQRTVQPVASHGRTGEFMMFNTTSIQGVSRLVDITAGGDFLGLCDQKSSY
jgi:hypothetical protein